MYGPVINHIYQGISSLFLSLGFSWGGQAVNPKGRHAMLRRMEMSRDFARKFYSSKQWQDCRNNYAASRKHLCENCLAKGIIKPGVIVHHIEELTPINIENPEIALGFNNLRLVCRDCHAEEHKPGMKDRRYLIGEDGKVIIR